MIFGLTQHFWVALAALALMGAGDMVSVYVRGLLVQLETPDGIRGRVSAVEPGAAATELTSHIRDGIREQNQAWYASMETLQPQDIADAVTYIVTRPRHVAVNELLVRPTEQA